MKKLLLILFCLPVLVFGQEIIGDSAIIYGGGSFNNKVTLLSGQIVNGSDTAIDANAVYNYVGNPVLKIDATNPNSVILYRLLDTIRESFIAAYPEYMLKSNLDGYVPYLGAIDNVDLGNYNMLANKGVFDTVTSTILNSDSVTLTIENGIKDASNALVTSNEVYDLFHTTTGLQVADSSLTAVEVGNLGSSYDLLPALSGTNYYKIWGISINFVASTVLEVGSQDLEFYHSGSGTMGIFSNAELESTGGVYHIFIENTKTEVKVNSDGFFSMKLSGSTNPVSGSATLRVKVYYSIENY